MVNRQQKANNARKKRKKIDGIPNENSPRISFFVSLVSLRPHQGPLAKSGPACAAPDAGWDLPLRASEWMDTEWPHALTWIMGLVLTREVVCGWCGPVETQPAKGLQLTTSHAACWQVHCRSKKGKKILTREKQ